MVDLQPGDPHTCDAVISNPPLPGKEFFLRKFIAAASFLETDGAATHGRDNRGLCAVRPSVLMFGGGKSTVVDLAHINT